MSFLKNSWYVAGWPHEFGETLVSRTILGRPVVIFRRGDGSLVALEDRCAHRHVPLSKGKRIGDEIECAYHGLRFDGTGRCVHVPAQDTIPTRPAVRSYPVAEKHGWAWVYTGAPAMADPATIPDFHWLGDPAYAATGETTFVNCQYELLNDNLLDLSHVGFVHATTIGNNEMGSKGRISVKRTERGVEVTRWVIDCAPPPSYCKTGVFQPTDRIDRWQIIEWEPPSFIRIYVGGAPTGTGAPEGNRVGGLGLWVLHAMTPETATTTRYHWAIGRDFKVDVPEITKVLHREIATAFDQDREILEIQQRAMDTFEHPQSVDIVADSGAIQARRILRRLLEEEAAQTAEPRVAVPA